MTPKAYILPKKSLKQELKGIWIQFLAEVVARFVPDRTTYMRFTRQIGFHSKVKTLTKQALAK